MIVITKNSEEKLFKDLKASWENHPTLRCLHLKLSQLEGNIEEILNKCLITLRIYLEDTSCQAYICHDHDVFVLSRSMTQKRLDDFLTRLAPHLAPAPPPKGLASLFEVGIDWAKLRTLCKKKMENLAFLKSKSSPIQKEELEFISSEETIKKINIDLINSLADRRAARDKPEIMVVEDDPFSQKLVSNALKNKYTHSMTEDGQGAIMNYVSKAPDVLFLDIGLPDIDGHEVLKKLFEIDPDAYVVMFSGNGDKENIMRAIQLGAKGFVGKPFTQEKLFEYIEKSPLSKRSRSRKIFMAILFINVGYKRINVSLECLLHCIYNHKR